MPVSGAPPPGPRPRRAEPAARLAPERLGRAAGGRGRARSSTNVFHSPQPGQRPCHLGLSCPHAEQTKRVAERAIPARLSARWTARPSSPRHFHPSGGVACIGSVELLEQPVAGAEFVAVDTETNGRGGELCELTEVGAVLVGGGELHETWTRSCGRRDAAVARHPALHRDHPGDGRRRAAAGGGPAGAGASSSRAVCSWPTTRASTGACCARPSSAWDRLARPARSSAPCAGAPVRAARAPARARSAGGGARHRGRWRSPGAPRRAHLRARVLRALPAPVRARRHRRRRARAAAAPPPRARKTEPAERIPPRRAPRPVHASGRPGRLHLPRRPRRGRSTWASRCRCARARGPTSARPRAGPSAPRSWTTGPPTPSWARSCSRTG